MSFDYPPTVLPERACIIVSGPDAISFLNGLLTVEITGTATYGALLSPQGKILFDMFLSVTETGVLIDCSTTQLEGLLKRLGMYKLRARITISTAHDVEVAAGTGERPHSWRDPRLPAFGWRIIAPRGSFSPAAGYHAARIAAGLADTDADLGSGEFFPHEANFDQFGAVSFTKGCFIGQEVVSRMEHRGTARSRILPVRFEGAATPKGSDIRAGEKSIGTVLGSDNNMALALIRLDRLAEATEPLQSGSVKVKVLKPAFARYDVPNARDH